PGLRLQASVDDHHPILVVKHVKGPTAVALRGLPCFGDAIDAAPAADDTLDVLSGAGPAHRKQSLFGLWRRDASQRAHFRVRELTAGERLGEPPQGAQRFGDAHTLASRAGIETDAPREPCGTRAEAGTPAAARVELADEVKQASSGRVEMSGQLCDLIAEALELNVVWMSRNETRAIDVHHDSPCADSNPHFRGLRKAPRRRDYMPIPIFPSGDCRRALERLHAPLRSRYRAIAHICVVRTKYLVKSEFLDTHRRRAIERAVIAYPAFRRPGE